MTEKLYTDFTNNILPAIQEGLVITQDYFTELFSRYVKYLIITDAIYLAFSILSVVLLLVVMYKVNKFGRKIADGYHSSNNYSVEFWPILVQIIGAVLIPVLIAIISVNVDNLIKAIYVPEVRVYEELKPLMK